MASDMEMEQIGEELYGMVVQVYPELAGKLTGMLLQLGRDECIACLDSIELLAERLDEAFRILDSSGQGDKQPPPEEKRVDPEDGQSRTLKELHAFYAKVYSASEIDAYWQSVCQPVGKKAASNGGVEKPAKQTITSSLPAPAAPEAAEPSNSGPAAPATPVSPPPDEALPGLVAWLKELRLSSYAAAATEWIDEQGACSLDEVVENLDDFSESLSLKPLERKRLEKSGAEAAAVAKTTAAAEAEAWKKAQQEQKRLEKEQASSREVERASQRPGGKGGAGKGVPGDAEPREDFPALISASKAGAGPKRRR